MNTDPAGMLHFSPPAIKSQEIYPGGIDNISTISSLEWG